MTRSIFDPTGGETERSGSRFLGPDAADISSIPPDAVDGEANDAAGEGVASASEARADELPQDLATDSAEVARRLGEMTLDAPLAGDTSPETPPPASV